MAEQHDKDQKTEEATPKRREEARDKGQVAISSELISGTGLAIGFGLLLVVGGPLARTAAGRVVDTIGSIDTLGTTELSVPVAAGIIDATIRPVLPILLSVMLPTILLGALAGYAQVGMRFTPKAIELDPNKLNPVSGMSRLFSLRAVVRTLMSGAKVTAISAAVITVAWMHVGEIIAIGTSELGPLLAAVFNLAVRCVAAALVVILVLALVDLLFQRFQHSRDLRMTRQEVKEEHRLTDGDPHLRARIRQIQREFATTRMMADVPDATVVVTNPTHYAVALRYDLEASQGAPIVVAKGVDHVAQRIKQVAAENGVLCHEDVPLARALHAQAEVGQEIPEDLYAAVAAVLGYVYRLREGAVATAAPAGVGV